jgi:hypothetical protein
MDGHGDRRTESATIKSAQEARQQEHMGRQQMNSHKGDEAPGHSKDRELALLPGSRSATKKSQNMKCATDGAQVDHKKSQEY